tara:strand:+ start:2475 stop:2951 length:477 start_codon:yes stop_codon:yes gene_type:complete
LAVIKRTIIKPSKSDIKKIIKYKRKSNLINHLRSCFTRSGELNGDIQDKRILLWSADWYNPLFFPILQFDFDDNNELIKISSKLNSFGLLFIIIIPSVLLISFLFDKGFGVEFFKNSVATLVLISFIIILILTFYTFYRFERKSQLNYIAKILDKRTD